MTHEIVRHHDADHLATETAARLATSIALVQASFGSASVVLTGGRIAGALMFALADPMTADAVDWSRLDLWWGDERYLPAGDSERNDFLADTRLLSQVNSDPTRIHRICGPDQSESVLEAALSYADKVTAAAQTRALDGRPAFDLVLLSIGPDGHIASLFPESPSLTATDLVIAVHDSPKPPSNRVTLSFDALNDSTEAWLLASGPEKANVVNLMLTQGAGPLQIPAAGVSAIERTLLLLDESAAGQLSTDIGKR